MNLKHYVIHKIDKERNAVPDKKLSNSLPPVTALATGLIQALNGRYRQIMVYGRFIPDSTVGFASKFQAYADTDMNDATFLEFTKTVTNLLHSQIVSVNNATGGHLLFAQYEYNSENFMSVFMVRNAKSFQFKEEEEYFDVTDNLHIDIEKLAMACRINFGTYAIRDSVNDNYLSFVRSKRQTTSEYFFNWIEAEQLHPNAFYTDLLCEIFKNIELPRTLGETQNPGREMVQKQVYNYCTNLPQKQLNLIDLGRELYGEEEENKIIDYAEARGIQIATNFTPNKKSLRALYRLDVNYKDISLKFDYTSYQAGTVRINNNLVIIESASLVRQIQQRIAGEESEE